MLNIRYMDDSAINLVVEKILKTHNVKNAPINIELIVEKMGLKIIPVFTKYTKFKGCLFS